MWERIKAFADEHYLLTVLLGGIVVFFMVGFGVVSTLEASKSERDAQLENNCHGVIIRGVSAGGGTFAVCIPPELLHMLEERER